MRNGVVFEKSEHNALVSIIVPVYNAEKYLNECIQGVLNQTFKEWELLLVDDGSGDSSSRICDAYSTLDDRIKSIHKSNEGVSIARNTGLDLTSSKYVIFLDADDYWYDSSALERLYNLAVENDLDIIRGEYKAVDDDGMDLFCCDISIESMRHSQRLLSSPEFLKYAIHGDFFLVLSLIKRSIIGEIRFDSQRIFLEDVLFYSNLLLNPTRSMYVPNIKFYAYRKHDLSVSKNSNPQKIHDAFKMCYDFRRLVSMTKDKDTRRIFEEKSIKMYYSTLDTVSLDEYYYDRSKYIKCFGIDSIRKDIVRWIFEYPFFVFSPIYFLSPNCGIVLFRFRHSLGKMKRKILSIILNK